LKRAGDAACGVFRVPRLHPRTGASLKGGNDYIGYGLIDIGPVGIGLLPHFILLEKHTLFELGPRR
jgi:hypothetical protein